MDEKQKQQEYVAKYIFSVDELLAKLDGGEESEETVALDKEMLGEKYDDFEAAITEMYEKIKAARSEFEEKMADL